MNEKRPIRVLHSFGSLGKGGIETWLMNVMRLRSGAVQFDFFLNNLGGAYDAEAISRGSLLHHAPPIRRLKENLRFLEQVLTRHRYDVFHVHGEEFMGDAVKIAAKAGVPVRIAHCHGTQLARGKRGVQMRIRSWRHRTVDRSRIQRYATDILACSSDAGRFLMGGLWDASPKSRVLYCGVPLDQFRQATAASREGLRDEHGIPREAIVVGHAGSMGPSPVKNHLFIVEIFAELARRDARYHLYLAGDGPLRQKIRREVERRGLEDRVLMPGNVANIPSLMVHGFNVHLLPSLFEGLPVVGLEAVAAGLYTVCADTITRDFTERLAHRVKALPLSAPVAEWADAVEQAIDKRVAVEEGCGTVDECGFSIKASLDDLLSVYQSRL